MVGSMIWTSIGVGVRRGFDTRGVGTGVEGRVG